MMRIPFRSGGRGRGRRIRPWLLLAGIAFGGLFAAGVRAVTHPSSRLLSLISRSAPGGELHTVPYMPGARHSMDIFLPQPTGQAPPVVVFFYGGAWQAGDKEQYRYVGRSLATCGVMAIIPDYRIWPEVRFPAFLQDGAAAVRGAIVEARRLGGDTGHVFLMGHSAGAHIAAMLGLDRRWLEQGGLDADSAISGVIGLAGVYDFRLFPGHKHKAIFAAAGAAAEPVTFADHVAPPVLLMAGRRDRLVDPANTRSLADRLAAAGTPVRSVLVKKASHADLVHSFAWSERRHAPVLAESCGFIHALAARNAGAAP